VGGRSPQRLPRAVDTIPRPNAANATCA
jgi:hypothetical protein